MPKPAAHVLIWSTEHHYYHLHTENHSPQTILPRDEGIWQAWLTGHSSFSFQGQHGHLNVLKENRSRGKGYWYAYHTHSGQTRKCYIGPDARASLTRLEEIALRLNSNRQEQPHSLHPTTASISWQTPTADVAMAASTITSTSEFNTSAMIVMNRLSPPLLPTTFVVRERLLLALDSALSHPLTLFSASAGWGKTTLLSAWAQRQHRPVAWLSLEALDNDPTRFWVLIITALRTCLSPLGQRALTLLQDGHLSPGLHLLLHELAEKSAPDAPILLLLDDYHVINEPTIHASLTFFLEHLPPHVHLLLTSRIDPDLPLARLRARGQMREIRDSDLRFTREETQLFLTHSMELVLSQADIALLQTRTEGWIAGLHLAALVLQKQAAPSAYVSTLSGSSRFLLDYLRDEILANLSPSLQDFLLQTSVLSRLSASLCDAITGRSDSDLMLEHILRANLFLQALPGEQQWYRYHMLWAQALQHEAQRRVGISALQNLYKRASHWYEDQCLLPEAIDAALTGKDYAHAASLLHQFVIPQSFRNAYRTLAHWLKSLPEQIMQTRPDLCFQAVLAFTFTTDRRSPETWERVERLLQWAEQGFEAMAQWDHLGEAFQLHTDLAFFQDDLPRMLLLSQQAQQYLSENSFLYPNMRLCRGIVALLAGEVNEAWWDFLEGYQGEKMLSDHSATLAAYLYLGETCLEKGELRRASSYYQQALAHMHEDQEIIQEQLRLATGSTEPFFASWVYHCLARLAYERNECVNAQHALSDAIALRAMSAETVHVLTSGMLVQARLLHACGQTEEAQELLARWERQAHFPWALRVIRTCRAQLQLATGDLSAVTAWVQEQTQAEQAQGGKHMQAFPLIFQHEEALLYARFYITQGQTESALQALAPWKEKAQAQGRKRAVLQILLLEALAYAACQQPRQARHTLLQALRLAQPENFQRLFLDEGSTMQALLKTLRPELREASLISFVRTLLHAFTQEPTARSAVAEQPSQPDTLPLEPLSHQEQRVLRLLIVGRSNPEIARELVISVNTVKTHVQSIYRKLGVRSRTEASAMVRHWSPSSFS